MPQYNHHQQQQRYCSTMDTATTTSSSSSDVSCISNGSKRRSEKIEAIVFSPNLSQLARPSMVQERMVSYEDMDDLTRKLYDIYDDNNAETGRMTAPTKRSNTRRRTSRRRQRLLSTAATTTVATEESNSASIDSGKRLHRNKHLLTSSLRSQSSTDGTVATTASSISSSSWLFPMSMSSCRSIDTCNLNDFDDDADDDDDKNDVRAGKKKVSFVHPTPPAFHQYIDDYDNYNTSSSSLPPPPVPPPREISEFLRNSSGGSNSSSRLPIDTIPIPTNDPIINNDNSKSTIVHIISDGEDDDNNDGDGDRTTAKRMSYIRRGMSLFPRSLGFSSTNTAPSSSPSSVVSSSSSSSSPNKRQRRRKQQQQQQKH